MSNSNVYWKYFIKTADEFKYVAALALMPVWLGALISLLIGKGFFPYLNMYFKNGEALLYCAATVGPLLYVMSRDDQDLSESNKPFPGKNNFIVIIVVICTISAAMLGLRSVIQDSQAVKLEIDVLWWLSVVITTVSLIIWFLVNGIRLTRETGAPSLMRQNTATFLDEFERSRDD